LPGIVEAVSTLGLLGFALWQMGFVRRSTTATENAANAASENAIASKTAAEATNKALRAERPYLLVEKINLYGFPPKPPSSLDDLDSAITAATFTLKNYGKGPALIEDVVVKLSIVSELPGPKDFRECKEWKATIDAVAPNGCFMVPSSLVDAGVPDEVIQAVIDKSKMLIAYGRVRYKDVFDNSYETGFFWINFPALDNLRSLGLLTSENFLYIRN
jgi:hypothetical protein